jgi:hypothetical protein
MGATTYIGNGPNLMVKAIAGRAHFPVPGFFRYAFFAFAVMIPAHVVTTLALVTARALVPVLELRPGPFLRLCRQALSSARPPGKIAASLATTMARRAAGPSRAKATGKRDRTASAGH